MKQPTPKDLKPADYNPRKFDEQSLNALHHSIDEFGDISGITWNSESGNIITGHHRWDHICEKYGIDNLGFKQVGRTDRYLILCGKKNTGYTVRVVAWDMVKEKSANIIANSHAVEGKFTKDLQDLLGEIKPIMEDDLFSDLRLDTLELKAPSLEVDEDEDIKKEDGKKSEMVISSGGEKYKLVKMELSPELAKRFHDQLDRIKKTLGSGSVEQPLEAIINYIENKNIDEIVWATKSKKIRKRRKKS